jgi:hypothetical protein
MDSIPNEIKTHIFSFITEYKDIGSLRQTCPLFDKICKLNVAESYIELLLKFNGLEFNHYALNKWIDTLIKRNLLLDNIICKKI